MMENVKLLFNFIKRIRIASCEFSFVIIQDFFVCNIL